MNKENKSFDITVIGSGPGGYVAAIKAAQLGFSVCIIEKSDLGGVCLNWGCIPTKSLLHFADLYNNIKKSQNYGISVGNLSLDINKIVENSRNSVKQLSSGVAILMKKNKITTLFGYAKIITKNEISIELNNEVSHINTKYIIIATGASARVLPNLNIDENLICTAKGAMTPKQIPQNVTIIGGGVIGIEFAYFYNSIGSKVTILEMAPNILMTEDLEISKKMHDKLIAKGINIITHININSIIEKNNAEEISYNKDQIIICDKLILAIGIIPNINNIGLENINIKIHEKGFIETDKYNKTNIDNIYAIGDVTSGPWLAHKASHEGVIASSHIAQKEGKSSTQHIHELNKTNIPSCIYTDPQIASIGLREQDLTNKDDYNIGYFSGIGNGKAIVSDNTDAFIKIITDKTTGEIIGCHMIGKNVSELIHSIAGFKNSEMIVDDIINTVFPHPTLSEMIHEASLDTKLLAIHK